MRQAGAILFLLLLCVTTAHGADDADGADAIDAVADRVVAAVKADDTDALRALASQDHPDPWLVADALEARGAHAEARRFAQAAPRIDVQGLPAYLKDRSKREAPADARKRLTLASRAFAAQEYEQALGHLDGLTPPASVLAVRVHTLRGRALHALGRYAQAAPCFVAAAEMAERMKWWAQASDAFYLAGLTYDYRDDGKGMHALFSRQLQVEERLQSTMGQGRAHYRLGNAHIVNEQWEAARRHQQISLEQARKVKDHEYVAKGLANEAILCFRADPARALELAQQGVAEIEKVGTAELPTRFRPDPLRIARSKADMLLLAASAATALNRPAVAERHASAAVTAAEASRDERTVEETRAFLAVVAGERLASAGRDAEALLTYERAHRLYTSLGEETRAADALRRIASAQTGLGDLPAAYESLQRAFRTLRSRPAEKRLLCQVHIDAGIVCLRLGRGSEALANLKEARDVAAELGDERLHVAALLGLSRYHASRTEFAPAVTLAKRVLTLLAGSDDRGARGRAHLALSQLYRNMGSPIRAAAELQLAVENLQAIGDARNLWTVRNEQAYVLQTEGDLKGARRVLTALRDEQKRLGNLRGVAWAEMGLANTERGAGKHGKAAEHRDVALRLFEKLGAERTATFARVQLGVDLVWAGDPKRGLEQLATAHKEAQASGDIWTLATCCMGLAHASARSGDHAACMSWAAQGLELTAGLGLDLAEGEGALAREGFSSLPLLGAEAARALGDAKALYRFLEQGRAATLLSALGGRKALRNADVSAELERAEAEARTALAAAHDEFRAVVTQKPPAKRPEQRKAREKLDAARAALRDALADIRRAVRMQADLAQPTVAPLAEIENALKEHEALVLYATLAERTVAVVIRKSGTKVRTLAAAKDVRAAVADLRDFVADEFEEEQGQVKALRKLLIDRLELDTQVNRVLVSTNADIAFVPFALLLPKRQIAYVPSATGFGVLNSLDPVSGSNVLAFGNPAYEGRLKQLKAAAAEVEAIAKGKGDVVFTGKQASKTQLLEIAANPKRWRAVHFACHGKADELNPTMSRLELAADEKSDGSLWALDVFNLDLPADLVVLSACETGLGRRVTGEGIIGLTRAFMVAGSPRVICTLWEVPDKASGALMTRFYELWNPEDGSKRIGAAEALRQAQAFVRSHDKWKHPHYWAAWVLWGLPE